jgi:hypothetical protein
MLTKKPQATAKLSQIYLLSFCLLQKRVYALFTVKHTN